MPWRAIVRLTAIRSSRVSSQLLYFGPDRSPAGPGFDGTGAAHTHMTNTRLTDPEMYPVLRLPRSPRFGRLRTKLRRRAHMAGGSCDEDHCAAPRSCLTHTYLGGYM